jgi:hypothetical protein
MQVIGVVVASDAARIANFRAEHCGTLVSNAAIKGVFGKPITVTVGFTVGDEGWIVAAKWVSTNLPCTTQGRH